MNRRILAIVGAACLLSSVAIAAPPTTVAQNEATSPFASDAEAIDFLRNAEVVSMPKQRRGMGRQDLGAQLRQRLQGFGRYLDRPLEAALPQQRPHQQRRRLAVLGEAGARRLGIDLRQIDVAELQMDLAEAQQAGDLIGRQRPQAAEGVAGC